MPLAWQVKNWHGLPLSVSYDTWFPALQGRTASLSCHSDLCGSSTPSLRVSRLFNFPPWIIDPVSRSFESLPFGTPHSILFACCIISCQVLQRTICEPRHSDILSALGLAGELNCSRVCAWHHLIFKPTDFSLRSRFTSSRVHVGELCASILTWDYWLDATALRTLLAHYHSGFRYCWKEGIRFTDLCVSMDSVNLGSITNWITLIPGERRSKHGPLVSDDAGPKASLAFTLTTSMRCSFFQLYKVNWDSFLTVNIVMLTDWSL